jgi:FtsH-binding integral membrane protein
MDELINQLQTSVDFKNEILFVKFQYVEVRDLLKHFLTLISASLVFSFTFSEKIIDYQNAPRSQKFMLYASWTMLVLSLGFCGYALDTNYKAAEIALKNISHLSTESYLSKMETSLMLQKLAATFYGLGLTLLISTSLFKLKLKR